MKTILFQGDSITDCCRDRNNFFSLGPGYPCVVSGKLGFDYPGKYQYINRSISGNRSVDIYARIKSDIINLKPDYLSFLFGVNDVWHEICWNNGVNLTKFERIYRMMLDEIIEALPNIKIILMEPYVLRGTSTENTEEIPDKWQRFSENVPLFVEAVDRIAKDYNLPIVPLYKAFNDAFEKSGDSRHWTHDGVHPTYAGHTLIAKEWLKVFETIQ